MRIALAGDSTVQKYNEPHICGWGQTIGLFLNDNCLIENHAVGGRSTKTFILEKRWEKLLAEKPDAVLMQFGHNDSHERGRPESTEPEGEYLSYLRQYADDAGTAGILPVFITPMHRRRFDESGHVTHELRPYAEVMKRVAAEKKIFCVDLYESSGALYESLGEEGLLPFFCNPEDRSHFSPAGAYRIAGLIADGLRGGPLEKLLRPQPLPLPAIQPATPAQTVGKEVEGY